MCTAWKRWSLVYVYRPLVSKWMSLCLTHDTCDQSDGGCRLKILFREPLAARNGSAIKELKIGRERRKI